MRGITSSAVSKVVKALAAAADLLSFAGQARVDDFRLFVIAERAMHQFV
jgi:hypothetical protein